MKKLIILTLAILLVCFTSNVKAELPNNTFSEGEIINLYIFCIEQNNSICSSSTSCELTALYPNSSLLVEQVPMSYNESGFFNYTFDTNLTVPGSYPYLVYCNNSEEGVGSFSFLIGTEELNDYWTLAFVLIVLGLAGFFAYLSIRLDSEHLILKWAFFVLSTITLTLLAGVMNNIVEYLPSIPNLIINEAALTNIGKNLSLFYIIMGTLSIIIMLYLLIIFSQKVWGLAKTK